MSDARQPVVRATNQGRTISVVGDLYRFLAEGSDTAGKYATFHATVPPGGGPPPHKHSREEESFYVLEGEITFSSTTSRPLPGRALLCKCRSACGIVFVTTATGRRG